MEKSVKEAKNYVTEAIKNEPEIKLKVNKYEGVLYNTASFGTLPSPVTAPLVLRRQ